MIAISLAAFFFMLPWQFAQFALLTQTACVFALYMLEYIGSWKVGDYFRNVTVNGIFFFKHK